RSGGVPGRCGGERWSWAVLPEGAAFGGEGVAVVEEVHHRVAAPGRGGRERLLHRGEVLGESEVAGGGQKRHVPRRSRIDRTRSAQQRVVGGPGTDPATGQQLHAQLGQGELRIRRIGQQVRQGPAAGARAPEPLLGARRGERGGGGQTVDVLVPHRLGQRGPEQIRGAGEQRAGTVRGDLLAHH